MSVVVIAVVAVVVVVGGGVVGVVVGVVCDEGQFSYFTLVRMRVKIKIVFVKQANFKMCLNKSFCVLSPYPVGPGPKVELSEKKPGLMCLL